MKEKISKKLEQIKDNPKIEKLKEVLTEPSESIDYKKDFKLIGKNFWVFLKENETTRYMFFILIAGVLVWGLSKLVNYRFLSFISYFLGIILFIFLIYYFYKDWNAKRAKYVKLEEKMNETLEEMVEDEEFDEEILSKVKKGKKKNEEE